MVMRPPLATVVLAAALSVGLSAAPARADQNDPRLEGLFWRLKEVSSSSEARRIEAEIWQIWLEGENEDANLLMGQGVLYMARRELSQALLAFEALVQQAPRFAEGWNKRATVNFLIGNYDASVRDIERTLVLEPRHFGALSGLGQIYLALGRKEAALKAFEAALAINPHLSGIRSTVETLRKEVGGSPT
jgi:tetratricopeptide (TPR) repeat protein